MAWFEEACINFENIDMDDFKRIIIRVAPLHCADVERAAFDTTGDCHVDHLKINNKTSPLVVFGNIHPLSHQVNTLMFPVLFLNLSLTCPLGVLFFGSVFYVLQHTLMTEISTFGNLA